MNTPPSNNTLNTAGSPDLSFGTPPLKDGTVINTRTAGISRVLEDGSTITAGPYSEPDGPFIGITKQTPTGENDARFGRGLTAMQQRQTFIDMLIQPNGRQLLLATHINNVAVSISRFNEANGNSDFRFGNNGEVVLNKRIQLNLNSKAGLALQSDDKIICVFNDGTSSFIYQLSSSGQELNFGFLDPLEERGALMGPVLTTERGFLIAGSINGKALIKGFTHAGEADTAFGNAGYVQLELSGTGEKQASALAKGPDGRIVVVGGEHRLPRKQNFVTSLLANGQPDPQFNGGIPKENDARHGSYDSVTVQPDGKIVVLWRNTNGSLVELTRYTATGQLDLTFGDQGVADAWRDPQSRPQISNINKLEWVNAGETLQTSGVLEGVHSFIGRLLSQ
ncbi:hypothetical protein [Pseudomonas sp. CF10PS3]|jgi:uncharacterized delta-60 repeat protein